MPLFQGPSSSGCTRGPSYQLSLIFRVRAEQRSFPLLKSWVGYSGNVWNVGAGPRNVVKGGILCCARRAFVRRVNCRIHGVEPS